MVARLARLGRRRELPVCERGGAMVARLARLGRRQWPVLAAGSRPLRDGNGLFHGDCRSLQGERADAVKGPSDPSLYVGGHGIAGEGSSKEMSKMPWYGDPCDHHDQNGHNTKSYVGHFSPETRAEDFEHMLSRYGRVQLMNLKCDSCFVEHSDTWGFDDWRFDLGREFGGNYNSIKSATGVQFGPGGSSEYGARVAPHGFDHCLNPGIEVHWEHGSIAAEWKTSCYCYGEKGQYTKAQLLEPQRLTSKAQVSAASVQLWNLFARRCFSSDQSHSDDDDEYIAHPVDLKMFPGLGPGDTDLFIRNLKMNTKKLESELEIAKLRAEFDREFRPALVASMLMLPHSVDHYTTAYLHGPLHNNTRLIPLYLSSYDLMVRMKGLNEEDKGDLLAYIIKRRVAVAYDWVHTFGNIEKLVYRVGTSDPSAVRLETDATFEELKLEEDSNESGSTKSGIAKLATMIWLKYQLLWAEKFKGIFCSDNGEAEVLAVLAGLDKCEELGFENVELWSDSRRACGVMSGSETIRMDDKNRMECLLLRSKLTRFKTLVSVQKPREILFLVDDILREDDCSGCLVRNLLQKWSPYLRGRSIYSITRTKHTTDIIRNFGETRSRKKKEGYVHKAESTFYWKVEKGQKLEGFLKMLEFLEPWKLDFVVDRFEEKPSSLQRKFMDMFPVNHPAGTSTIFEHGLVNPQQRRLVVAWDACVSTDELDYLDYTFVILTDEEEEVEELKKRKIREINMETYLHFQRADYKEEEDKGKKRTVGKSKNTGKRN